MHNLVYMFNINLCSQFNMHVKTPFWFLLKLQFHCCTYKIYFTISLLFCVVIFHLYLSSFQIFFGRNINALNSFCLGITLGNIYFNFWYSFSICFSNQFPKFLFSIALYFFLNYFLIQSNTNYHNSFYFRITTINIYLLIVVVIVFAFLNNFMSSTIILL